MAPAPSPPGSAAAPQAFCFQAAPSATPNPFKAKGTKGGGKARGNTPARATQAAPAAAAIASHSTQTPPNKFHFLLGKVLQEARARESETELTAAARQPGLPTMAVDEHRYYKQPVPLDDATCRAPTPRAQLNPAAAPYSPDPQPPRARMQVMRAEGHRQKATPGGEGPNGVLQQPMDTG